MRRLAILSVSSLLIFSSCGKVNDMHDATMKMSDTTADMAKTTNEMSDTTKGMSKTTNDMAKTTDHMSVTTDGMSKTTERMEDTTCKMYTSLRQGNAKVSRDTDMKSIQSAKNITEKLELAAKYMQGFEYQVWTKSCADMSPREITIDQAATELLTTIQPYAKSRGKVTATKQSSDYETLYAMAATLHRTNLLQSGFLAGSDEKLMTPMDILTEGLKYNQQKNRGELADGKFPMWATTVGKYEKDAEFLLRLRGNFLMAYGYAIADSNDFGDSPGTWTKAKRLLGAKNAWYSRFFSKSWKPNLEKRDATEIHERITVSLQLAKQTRDALTALGIDPMVDETTLQIWKNADFSKIDLVTMEKGNGDDRARANAIRELMVTRTALTETKEAAK